MKKIFLSLTLSVVLILLIGIGDASALVKPEPTALTILKNSGYSCINTSMKKTKMPPSVTTIFDLYDYITKCTKTVFGTYGATLDSPYQLTGYRPSYLDVQDFTYTAGTITNVWSPFITLHNPPDGAVSLTLSSVLNHYVSKPAFNVHNGWSLNAKNGKVFLGNSKVDTLFYELALKKIDLTRNGRNFASKEEVAAFLKDSDFLTKLGFTQEEKNNSLNYFLPKLATSKDRQNYYLTIMNRPSIDEVSQLNINPKPVAVHYKYFALYPSNVPVATTGDFVFPTIVGGHEKDFTVDVTGEFLVTPELLVFWTK